MKVDNKTILQIIIKALNIPSKSINEKTNLKTLEEWDSLGMLTVMSAIDKKFKGKINLSQVSNLNSYKDIKSFLKKKLVMK